MIYVDYAYRLLATSMLIVEDICLCIAYRDICLKLHCMHELSEWIEKGVCVYD